MLKTQLADSGLPVGCHWQSSHSLKERIEMLKQPLPARTRKIAGSLSVAFLVAGASWAAWAAQPAQASPSKSASATKSTTAGSADYLHRITSGDDLTPPAYPKGQTAHGKVLLELLVGIDGKVKDVKVVKSEPAGVFDQISIEAARKWHITPELKDGAPIERRVLAPIEFHPDGEPKGE
jgi:TonB family protein